MIECLKIKNNQFNLNKIYLIVIEMV